GHLPHSAGQAAGDLVVEYTRVAYRFRILVLPQQQAVGRGLLACFLQADDVPRSVGDAAVFVFAADRILGLPAKRIRRNIDAGDIEPDVAAIAILALLALLDDLVDSRRAKFENRHGSSIESANTPTVTPTECGRVLQLAASVHGGGIDKLLILQHA